MGWCGPAKHLSLPRSHIFPHQGLTARRGVYFGLYRIHRCMRHCGSTTSPLIPPPLRRRVVLLWCFVAFAAPSADPICSTISAAAVLKQLFTILPPCMSPNWFSTTVIQAPQMRAQPLRLVLAFLPLFRAGPVRPSVRVGFRHRIARLVRQVSFIYVLGYRCS